MLGFWRGSVSLTITVRCYLTIRLSATLMLQRTREDAIFFRGKLA
jgi:hypothetical protein